MKKSFPSILSAAAGLLAIGGMGYSALLLHQNFTDWRRSEDEIRNLQACIRSSAEIYSLVLTAESAARAYIITGRQEDLAPYDRALDDLGREVMALRHAVKGRPEQAALAEKLAGLVRDRRAAMTDTVLSRSSGGFNASKLNALTSRGTGLTAEIDRTVDNIQAEARKGLSGWERQVNTGSSRRTWLLASVFFFSILSMSLALAALLRSSRLRRAAEAELSEARSLLAGVMSLAGSASFVAAGLDGRITYVSPGAGKLLGWTMEESAGRSMIATLHLPAEVETLGRELSARLGRPAEGFSVFIEAALHGGQASRDWTYVRRDGTLCPVKLSVSPLNNAAGELAGVLVLAMKRQAPATAGTPSVAAGR